MTESQYNVLMSRIDNVASVSHEDVKELTASLALTRESLANCQGRCWVQAQARAMVAPWVSALAAVSALFLSALALLR